MHTENKYDEDELELTIPLQKNRIVIDAIGNQQIDRHTNKNSWIHRFCIQKFLNPSVRTILWYFIFTGFAINYMIRININMTIVAMIKAQGLTTKQSLRTVHECYNVSDNQQQTIGNSSTYEIMGNLTDQLDSKRYSSFFTIERELLKLFGFNNAENRFEWNEYQQNLVLGSYYWLQWFMQIPGGMLAKFYGTKLVFGLSALLSCLLCFLIPIAAYTSVTLLIILRVAQGILGTFAFAPMHNMIAHWIPPNERSSFVSAYFGNSAGMAILFPLFGYMLSVTSWEWVFHLCGIIGIIWYCLWQYCVYDTPLLHPRIEEVEKKFILESLGNAVNQSEEKPVIPWLAILKSKNLWINTLGHFGPVWTIVTLTTQVPTFLKIIHGLPVENIGIITGIPHLLRVIVALLFSFTTDYLLRSNKLSTLNVRRIAGVFSMIINGFCIIGLAFSGCSTTLVIVFIFLSAIVHAGFASGPMPNVIDNAPNYASIVMGIISTFSTICGFISPYIVGQLTLNNQTTQQWQYVFLISAGLLFTSGIGYVFFTDIKVEKWNYPKDPDTIG